MGRTGGGKGKVKKKSLSKSIDDLRGGIEVLGLQGSPENEGKKYLSGGT